MKDADHLWKADPMFGNVAQILDRIPLVFHRDTPSVLLAHRMPLSAPVKEISIIPAALRVVSPPPPPGHEPAGKDPEVANNY